MLIARPIKSLLRPVVRRVKTGLERLLFQRQVRGLRKTFGARVSPRLLVQADDEAADLARQLRDPWGRNFRALQIAGSFRGDEYWRRFSSLYSATGNAREKALEHSLSFELIDFSKVRRFCDIAASASAMVTAVETLWPGIECWKQDFEFSSDFSRRILGGLAQHLDGVPAGFFDALTLHCSFEHFHGHADTELMGEIDRVLSSRGACLILPLYLDGEHKIFFDPLRTPAREIDGYDPEARLCPTFNYRQRHGRYYDPGSLEKRVRSALPAGLEATLLHFTGQADVNPGIYLQFGLVIHRPESVYRR